MCMCVMMLFWEAVSIAEQNIVFHTWNMSYFEADSFKGVHCFDLTNAHLDRCYDWVHYNYIVTLAQVFVMTRGYIMV